MGVALVITHIGHYGFVIVVLTCYQLSQEKLTFLQRGTIKILVYSYLAGDFNILTILVTDFR